MSEYESNIPLPSSEPNKFGSLRGFGKKLKNCPIGKSFVWPCRTARGMASYATYDGIKIVTSQCEGGVRVWRER